MLRKCMVCTANEISYETYRSIFVKEFNISFGHPRTDTCSSCDEINVKIKALNAEINNFQQSKDSSAILEKTKEIEIIETENKVHRIKAQEFYNRKKTARISSRKYETKEAICMDFQKNLPVPNITTTDVYYRRQLSVFSFNIHILSSGASVFYVYPETIANK